MFIHLFAIMDWYDWTMKHLWPSLGSALLVFLHLHILIRFDDVSGTPCTFLTSDIGPVADCSGRRMTRFPAAWPHRIWQLNIASNYLTALHGLANEQLINLRQLDLSFNLLTSLPDEAFCGMPQLQELNLAHNTLTTLSTALFRGLNNLTSLVLKNASLTELSKDTLSHLSQLTSLDLSHNSMSADSIELLSSLTSLRRLDLSYNFLTAAPRQCPSVRWLDLAGNILQTLTNDSFKHMASLRYLSLQGNSLIRMEPAAFHGLNQLRVLDLRSNLLKLNSQSYSSGVFAPVTALEELYLNGNDDNSAGDFPHDIFTPLPTLKTLYLDSWGYSPSMLTPPALQGLTTLGLRPHGERDCNMKRIHNDTFTAFHDGQLRTLVIKQCALLYLDRCALCHLPALSSLVIRQHNYLPLSSLLLSLYGLQGQTLQLVDLSENNGLPTTLDHINTRYINTMCITNLSLRKCDIVALSINSFDYHAKLIQCLRHVDFSENAIGHISNSLYLRLLSALTNIQSIQAQNQRSFAVGRPGHRGANVPPQDIIFNLNIAGSLRHVNLSAAIPGISQLPQQVNFLNGGNLTELDLSYCGAYYCDIIITGLSNIRTANLGGNNCQVMGAEIFHYMTTLRRLLLANINIQEEFLMSKGTEMLRPLVALEELDISDNDLHRLPLDLLHHQQPLRRLLLANNRFQSVPVDLSQQIALSYLDLSFNMIHALPSNQRQALDDMAANHTFTLHLRGNPLTCTCLSLDMVKWLAQTAVTLDGQNVNQNFDQAYDPNGRDYPCVLEDGSMSSTMSVHLQLVVHWRGCMGLTYFTVSAVALLVQLLLLLLTYLVWSNWTFVCHAWRVLRHLQLPRRHHFVHDALLLYAEDDLNIAFQVSQCLQQAKPSLRLALPENEVLAGMMLIDQLPDLMQRSWKVVLLVTQTFLEDDMSGYVVMQAQSSISDTMPDRVLLLLVGDLQPGSTRCPTPITMKQLLRLIPESSVYYVSMDITSQSGLWSALSEDLVKDS